MIRMPHLPAPLRPIFLSPRCDRRAATPAVRLALLLTLVLPGLLKAQSEGDFNYTITSGTVTITGYVGTTNAPVIPDTITGLPVTRISSNTFASKGLTGVTISSNVTSIGASAFSLNPNLASVLLPSNLTNIGAGAFILCSGLVDISIPASVTDIGEAAFDFCGSLTNITVDPLNPSLSSLDGVLFDKLKTRLFKHPEGNSRIAYTSPESVTSIENFAFRNCRNLRAVTLGSSVTNIGAQAFRNCPDLYSLYFNGNAPATVAAGALAAPTTVYYLPGTTGWGPTFDERPTVEYVPEFVLAYNSNSNTITITDYIGTNSANTIPDSRDSLPITAIADRAFENEAGLKSVTISSNVTSIGAEAFRNCPGLLTIHFEGDAPAAVGTNVFDGTDNVIVYYLPGTTGWGATFAGRPAVELVYAYSNDTTGVIITGYNGTNTAPIIPNYLIGLPVTRISSNTFASKGLTGVTISSNVTSIGRNAFSSNTNLTSVLLPSNLTNIGAGAFFLCSGLVDISIPASVTDIGEAAFDFCSSLTNIAVDPLNPSLSSLDGVLFDKLKTRLFKYPEGNSRTVFTSPESVTSIENSAFRNCRNLRAVTLGSSVTNLGVEAFSSGALYSLYFNGDAPAAVAAGALGGNITVYYLPGTTGWGPTFDGRPTAEFPFTYSDTGSAVIITGHTGTNDIATLPNSIAGFPVTGIDDVAFSFNPHLVSVTIPETITSIGLAPFLGCANLVDIAVSPANPNYLSINGILFDKLQTLLVQYPAGKTAIQYTIPSSVTRIGGYAFYGCTSLASMTIPASVTSIEGSAFFACSGLTSMYFQGNAPTLGDFAFIGANSLTVYYLPENAGWGSTLGGRPAVAWNPRFEQIGLNFGVQSNYFGFVVVGPANAGVVIETTIDLLDPVWTPVSVHTLNNGSSTFNDPDWENTPRTFYRPAMPQ